MSTFKKRQTINWVNLGGGKLYSIIALHGCAEFQNVPALKTVLHWGFPRGTTSLPRKHLVCTNSLLSSVQAFIVSVTLLLQRSLNVKEFSVLIGGAMIDGVELNPYARWASFHCQEFEQVVAWMEDDQIPALTTQVHHLKLSQMPLLTYTGSQSCCSRRKPSYMHRPYSLGPTARC